MLNEKSRVVHNTGMNDPQPIDPRRRIRELLAIPDRDRTDEEWDELNELEIRTAPGNRESSDRSSDKRFSTSGPGQGHPRRQERKPERKGGNPRPESKGEKRPQEGRPDNRPQEGRGDGQGRSSRRQHRRPKRNGENQGGGGNAGPATGGADVGGGNSGSGSTESGGGSGGTPNGGGTANE